MEQQPGLIMSSQPASRAITPPPPTSGDPKAAETAAASKDAPAITLNDQKAATTDGVDGKSPADGASIAGAEPGNQGQASGSAQTTVQRAFQSGLSKDNLEQEVQQVMGTFNSWWGGFKKQSASAYTNIRAEVDNAVTQAQADLEYLRTAKVEIEVKDSSSSKTASGDAKDGDTEGDVKGKGKAKDISLDEPSSTAPRSPTSNVSFLDRITSSTNQLQQSLQTTFQSTIASASNNPALSNPNQLRAQLAENLRLSSAKQNLQLSMKQAEKLAEEYLHKGDKWMKDAEKWMEDAVKVIPPEDDDEARFIATTWDGGDFYSFSTSSKAKTNQPVKKGDVLFDFGNKTPRPSLGGAALAGSRKEALLRRLREDKDLLLVDPQGEGETEERKQEFKDWVEKKWPEECKGGKEKEEAHIGGIRMELVPEHLTDEQFWQRYLFHKHMIEAEDEKRKKLLEASQQAQQDDFSWDDEPDENSPITATSTNKLSQSVTTLRPPEGTEKDSAESTPKTGSAEEGVKVGKVNVPAVAARSSAQTSPRDSEESYDLVSEQGGKGVKPTPAQSQDDEDSDWE